MKNCLLSYLAVGVLLAGIVFSPEARADVVDGTGYTLDVPQGWLAISSSSRSDLMVIDVTTEQRDERRGMVVVKTGELADGVTPQQWLDKKTAQLRKRGVELEDYSAQKVAGYDAYQCSTEMLFEGMVGYVDSFVVFKDAAIYEITCVTREGDDPTVRETLLGVADSFTLKDK
ncbi:hypothetical protein [Ruficoccus sp. ZRK36]|uniref:PsbP-related protein n=1 Tax=Ruficoccus sp. ZRK36 TaxID=2866311 RepID=UPI001C737462|nr:hypothetical protein [Ruficoccus sp. ZRK36]QYY36478.1 hypothetical protein K0V07_03175 [Ruficoccus sp. ZRK36]